MKVKNFINRSDLQVNKEQLPDSTHNFNESLLLSDENIRRIAELPIEQVKSELDQLGALNILVPKRSALIARSRERKESLRINLNTVAALRDNIPVNAEKAISGSDRTEFLSPKTHKTNGFLNNFWQWISAAGLFTLMTGYILSIVNESLFASVFVDTAKLLLLSILIFTISALWLLIAAFLPKLKRFNLANINGELSIYMLGFDTYKDTSYGSVPEKHQPKNLTPEEKWISSQLKKIVSTGFNVDNCQKGLELLEENESIVRNSWMNTLNKARFLVGAGEREEPERIVYFVLEKYSDSREAVGSAYGVLSWLEELKYNEDGRTDRQSLDRRMGYINKGLQFYPEYYQLWINALEVACLKKNADAATGYLNELIKIDRKIAKQYFLDSPMIEEMKNLSLWMRIQIAWLINHWC